MSIIKVKCTDQVLTFESTPVIASGGLEEDYVQFSFCSNWDGFTRTAVFWRNEKEPYHQLLDENDSCQVPPEVTADEGLIYFGVFGVDLDGGQRTSNVLTYRIEKGAITTGTIPSDPTPDIYTQLLAAYAKVQYGTLTTENINLPAETAEALGLSEDSSLDDALLKLQEGGGGGQVTDLTGAVRYDTAQELTDEQKAQALANLGLDKPAEDGGAVLYDTVQELAETQQARARTNIGAASAADVDALEESVAGLQATVTSLDFTNWDNGSFAMTLSNGESYNGTVTFDSNGNPATISLNGNTLSLTFPE